jgi:hypothetical protein
MSQHFPRPGGSQDIPGGWLRRVLLGGWLRAYVVIVCVACGATELGAEGYSLAVGLPPVVLFCGLSVLGCLPRRLRWWFAILWLGACWGGSLVFLVRYH